MNRIIALALPAMTAIAVASPAFAQQATCLRYSWQGWRRVCVQWGSSTSSVPEINAAAGLLALAAVAAVVLLVWERRRQAA